jgi:hypothetical protein
LNTPGKGTGLLLIGLAVAVAVYLSAKATAGPEPGTPGGLPKTEPDAPPSPSAAVFGEFTTPHQQAQVDLPLIGPRSWHVQVRLWNTNPSLPVYVVPLIRTVWDDGAIDEQVALGSITIPPAGANVITYEVPTAVDPGIFGRNRATAYLLARIMRADGPQEIHLDSVLFTAT